MAETGGGPARAVALVGATGAGKSAIAEALARRAGGEIVACDSVQVYRGFDIGTAKPSVRRRREIPHHMVDVADWWEPFSVAAWRALAERALLAVRARGRLPILCGGSGLYLRALRDGLAPVPAADRAHQGRLLDDEARAPGSLWRRLEAADPALAARLGPANPRRLVRAVELCERCDEPPSVIYARHQRAPAAWPLAVWVVGRPPAELRARLAARARAMLAAGLVEEVRGHLAAGAPPLAPPMRAVGYREVVAHLAAGAPRPPGAAASPLAAAIAAASWRYARRQATWWRRETGVWSWRAGEASADAAAIAERLEAHVYPPRSHGGAAACGPG